MNTNQVAFSLMQMGEERRYTHVIMPNGTISSDKCRPTFTDVSIGILDVGGTITRPQQASIQRMEGMALLLSSTVSFIYCPRLVRAIDRFKDEQCAGLCNLCAERAARKEAVHI